MTLSTGQVVHHRYRIVNLLGEGGFGAVYRAWDTHLDCACALKMNLDSSTEAQRQFQREASILAQLHHPNLPMVTDHFIEQSGRQYLVMEYIEGEDLEQLIKRQGAIDPDTAVGWIDQVAGALSYLHSQPVPVIHRDIKPANIRISADGRAVLVDFGLVKLYDAHSRTTVGARAVTEGYAPPEQYGRGNTDARTDIYALGATLYSLLTGLVPVESVQRMANDQMAAARDVNARINDEISQTIARAMSLNPSQRYQTADDFRSALKPTALSTSQAGHVGGKPRRKRSRLGCLLLCLLLVAAVYWLVENNPSDAFQIAQDYVPAIAQAISKPTATAKSSELPAGASAVETADTPPVRPDLLVEEKTVGTAVFGPVNGSLRHKEGDGLLVERPAKGEWRDFVVEGTFDNPYAAESGAWNYGFLFRNVGFNDQLRLVIRSDKTWQLINRVGTINNVVQEGQVIELDDRENGSNKVSLVAKGGIGELYINDTFVSELDLSARMKAGEIRIMTGMDNAEINGSETRYRAFTVWSTP